jgi:AcrR family transcriptional regulator
MARQAERREATRGAILAAARRLFGKRGFAATSVDDVAREAGVAKGAVYHHFPTKEAIFEAVLEAVTEALARDVVAASRKAPDVLATLGAASEAYFAATAEPQVRRIVLQDGPAVLGWARWREIDLRHFEGSLPRALEAAMEQGLIARGPIEPLSRVLQGAMTEAAMAAVEGGDARAHLDALVRLVDGLRLR